MCCRRYGDLLSISTFRRTGWSEEEVAMVCLIRKREPGRLNLGSGRWARGRLMASIGLVVIAHLLECRT